MLIRINECLTIRNSDRSTTISLYLSFFLFFRICRRDAVSKIADSMSWSLDYVSRREYHVLTVGRTTTHVASHDL